MCHILSLTWEPQRVCFSGKDLPFVYILCFAKPTFTSTPKAQEEGRTIRLFKPSQESSRAVVKATASISGHRYPSTPFCQYASSFVISEVHLRFDYLTHTCLQHELVVLHFLIFPWAHIKCTFKHLQSDHSGSGPEFLWRWQRLEIRAYLQSQSAETSCANWTM